MTQDRSGLWPQDADGVDDNRSVDDLAIPDDDDEDVEITLNPDAELENEWGDDADNRLVDLGDDDPDTDEGA